MTTKAARALGFDVSTVPDGIEKVGQDTMARVSLVFRPNGKGNGLALPDIVTSDRLGELFGSDWTDLSDEVKTALRNQLAYDPNDFTLPGTWRNPYNKGVPETLSDDKARVAIWDDEGLNGRKSIAEAMIDNLAAWLRRLPEHLHYAAGHTGIYAEAMSPPAPAPINDGKDCLEINGNRVCIPDHIRRRVFRGDNPFDKAKTSGIDDPVEIIVENAFNTPVTEWTLPDVADTQGLVKRDPNGEAWPIEQVKAFWYAMFTEDELRDLARALLFPDDPQGQRTAEQKSARDPARATLRTDAASAMAAGMAEIKVQEILASVENIDALDKDRTLPFAKGLSAEDMIGTVYGRLLGTVRAFPTGGADIKRTEAAAAEEAASEEKKARFDHDADNWLPRTLEPGLIGLLAEEIQAETAAVDEAQPETAADAEAGEDTPEPDPDLPPRRTALEIAELAEKRRAATVRSMLYETLDTVSSLGHRVAKDGDEDQSYDPLAFVEQKIGDLRPGFGKLLFEVERRNLTAQADLEAEEMALWQKAFTGEKPDPVKSDLPLRLRGEINASEAVERAFAEPGSLALADDTELLREDVKSAAETTTYRDFVEVLAASKLAWRKSNGVVEDGRDSDAPQRALKRFQEIYAHPVLARGLGLVRDYHVKLDELSEFDRGFLRIGARAMLLNAHTQTAAYLDSSKSGSFAFRPAGRDEWFAEKPDPTDGLTNLAALRGDGTARYTLQTVDEQQLLRATEQAAQSSADALDEGLDPAGIDTSLPAMRLYGIALIDRGRLEAETSRKAAAQVARNWPGNKPLLAFAENLTIGQRIDIGIAQGDRTVWFNPGARDITYSNRPEHKILLPQTYNTADDGMEDMRHRTSSFVTPVNRYVDHPDAVEFEDRTKSALVGGAADIVAQQTLATWFGRSFLQRRAPDQEFLQEDFFAPMRDAGESPLPLFLDYYEPRPTGSVPFQGVASGVAPLIERVGYFAGARPVYINRGGPTIEEAWRAYDGLNGNKALRLGRGGAKTAFRFGRNEPIAAPEVLISDVMQGPAKEPLYYSHEPGKQRGAADPDRIDVITQWPGNSVEQMILRSTTEDDAQVSTDDIEIVQRFIVPPRVDITTAEFAGLLMGATPETGADGTNVPAGMFDGDDVHQVSWTGGFPMAEGGGEAVEPVQPTGNDPDPLNLGAEENLTGRRSKSDRGAVFRKKASRRPQYPWYPDPLANVLCVMPVRDGEPLLSEPVRVQVLASGKPWPNLHPALIQLMRKGANSAAETGFTGKEHKGDGILLRTGTTRIPFMADSVPTIGIWLDDGRSCELITWFAPARGEEIASHNLIQLLHQSQSFGLERFAASKALFGNGADLKSIEAPLLETLNTTPVHGLVNFTRLSLQSAVQKPLVAPDLETVDGASKLGFARLDISEAIADIMQAQSAISPKQAAIQALENIDTAKLIETEGGEYGPGATSIIFSGQVELDRPSTSEIRIEARWTDWTDDISRPARRHEPPKKDSGPEHEYFMRPFAPFTPQGWSLLEGTRTPVANTTELLGKPVDLLIGDEGLPRCLIHDFLDTRAREIELRLVAVSRHANRFTDSDTAEAFVTYGAPTRIKVPASARPPQPVLAEEMLPIFREERTSLLSTGFGRKRRSGLRIERGSALRYFLKRPWHDAGAGQKLAVLLWDGALFDPAIRSRVNDPATTPKSIPKEMRPFVSLHGRDPKFASASLPDFLTGADFINDVDRMARLTLPDVAPPETLPTGTTATDFQVSAALFDVYLDRKRDIWLADITMAARNNYMPFVRLSLAACQRNALSGLELSRPVEGWGRVPPRRDTSITVGYNHDRSLDGSVRIEVDGGVYTQRDPGPMLTDYAPDVNAPWLEVIFLERAAGLEGTGGWIRVEPSSDDDPTFVNPTVHQTGAAAASVSDKLWDFETQLPRQWLTLERAQQRAILLREYERVASDADGPVTYEGIADAHAIEVVESYAISTDGLSSVIRGKTTFAVLVTLADLLAN